METIQEKKVDPSKIMQIGMGFWASKTLLTAVNMKLFTHLAQGALSGKEIQIQSGDFFIDNFPNSDVITMGNILHDWGTKDKIMLIQKAYNALPKGGTLIVIENIIDDNRNKNAFGLMMSLNMMIETDEGFDFTAEDFERWANEVGFSEISVMPLTGPSSAVIANKFLLNLNPQFNR